MADLHSMNINKLMTLPFPAGSPFLLNFYSATGFAIQSHFKPQFWIFMFQMAEKPCTIFSIMFQHV